jgi:hypothetical protein
MKNICLSIILLLTAQIAIANEQDEQACRATLEKAELQFNATFTKEGCKPGSENHCLVYEDDYLLPLLRLTESGLCSEETESKAEELRSIVSRSLQSEEIASQVVATAATSGILLTVAFWAASFTTTAAFTGATIILTKNTLRRQTEAKRLRSSPGFKF